MYFEKESCKSHDALKSLKTLIGSKIILYKNGVYLNESAVNLYKGKYFPTLSLYKNCTLSANFGPDFQHPPPEVDDFKYKGVCILFLFQLIDNLSMIIKFEPLFSDVGESE